MSHCSSLSCSASISGFGKERRSCAGELRGSSTFQERSPASSWMDTTCSPDDETNRRLLHARLAGSKRQRAGTTVVHDDYPAGAGALVPVSAPRVDDGDGEPINSVPLAFPRGRSEPINAVPVAASEPWWIRERLFPHLHLRYDLPVHFIYEKAVTMSDLAPRQNRFRLPTADVVSTLRLLLTGEELEAANLHDGPPKKKTGAEELHGRKRRKHGGLPVLAINPNADIDMLQLSRWDSYKAIILKGESYRKFIGQCGFKLGDVVELWAFKERHFHYFGVTMCEATPLFIAIAKKEDQSH